MRLGSPLQCVLPTQRTALDFGGPVPLTRIKTLVSMTTPKDFRAHGSCTMPPFVEMDMSAEGFGCLYLPSIAPQNAVIPSVVQTGDATIIGGIGGGSLKIIYIKKIYTINIISEKFCKGREHHFIKTITIHKKCSQFNFIKHCFV